MDHRRSLVLAALSAFLVTGILAGSCSKSTSPYGSGGGGSPAPGGPSFNLGFPATGASAQVTFTDAGTWPYHCAPHQGLGMTGTVVVNASGADSDTVAVGVNAVGAAAFVFTPATVTIKPGGHVRWINRSSMTNHTVTRP
jgi:plastocyanin